MVAIDNCPHQVVVAGPPGEVDRVVAQLRAEGVVCEELPFARAYHTPAFSAVLAPLAAFFESLELHAAQRAHLLVLDRRPHGRICRRRFAGSPSPSGPGPSRFGTRSRQCTADGLRIFVDVGTRGNLCGYVEDILRGRPAFAVAANLPRRSGTAQLNHLVASLFAQGLLDRPHLSLRTAKAPADRPRRTTRCPARHLPGLELGFPELKLSDAVLARLRERSALKPDPCRSLARQPVNVRRGTELLRGLRTINAMGTRPEINRSTRRTKSMGMATGRPSTAWGHVPEWARRPLGTSAQPPVCDQTVLEANPVPGQSGNVAGRGDARLPELDGTFLEHSTRGHAGLSASGLAAQLPQSRHWPPSQAPGLEHP